MLQTVYNYDSIFAMVSATHQEKKPRYFMNKKTSSFQILKKLARAGVLAGLYFVFSFAVPALTYGPFQFRFSEAFCVLPALFPESILGITIGCLLANVLSPFGALDMVLGTFATLIASICTYFLRKRLPLASFPPVIINALIVPLIFVLNKTDFLYGMNFGLILFSQTVIIYGLGLPLAYALKKALPNEVDPLCGTKWNFTKKAIPTIPFDKAIIENTIIIRK